MGFPALRADCSGQGPKTIAYGRRAAPVNTDNQTGDVTTGGWYAAAAAWTTRSLSPVETDARPQVPRAGPLRRGSDHYRQRTGWIAIRAISNDDLQQKSRLQIMMTDCEQNCAIVLIAGMTAVLLRISTRTDDRAGHATQPGMLTANSFAARTIS
jgi:hypothetical protein